MSFVYEADLLHESFGDFGFPVEQAFTDRSSFLRPILQRRQQH